MTTAFLLILIAALAGMGANACLDETRRTRGAGTWRHGNTLRVVAGMLVGWAIVGVGASIALAVLSIGELTR